MFHQLYIHEVLMKTVPKIISCLPASTAFLGDSQPPGRKVLAMYPLCLFYFIISWLIISHTHSWDHTDECDALLGGFSILCKLCKKFDCILNYITTCLLTIRDSEIYRFMWRQDSPMMWNCSGNFCLYLMRAKIIINRNFVAVGWYFTFWEG